MSECGVHVGIGARSMLRSNGPISDRFYPRHFAVLRGQLFLVPNGCLVVEGERAQRQQARRKDQEPSEY
jgi:hypothetical protein